MKIYLLLAEGFETVEALTPIDILRRGKLSVLTMSNNAETTVTSSHQVKVTADLAFDAQLLADADVIILPGGSLGTENLAQNQALSEILKSHHQQGKLLAAICAAPSILANLGLLTGEKATVHPAFKAVFDQHQVLYQPTETISTPTIITSYGMAGSLEFAFAILSHLVDQTTVTAVKQAIELRD